MNNKRIGMIVGDLVEVKAYRDLQSEPFDFGTGLITNDCKQSEDAYYEMIEQDLECWLENYLEPTLEPSLGMEKDLKIRDNRYARKCIEKKILKDLQSKNVYQIYEKTDEETGNKYLKISYCSRRKRNAKKMTNRKLRQSRQAVSLRNGEYRKVFDYWWEVF